MLEYLFLCGAILFFVACGSDEEIPGISRSEQCLGELPYAEARLSPQYFGEENILNVDLVRGQCGGSGNSWEPFASHDVEAELLIARAPNPCFDGGHLKFTGAQIEYTPLLPYAPHIPSTYISTELMLTVTHAGTYPFLLPLLNVEQKYQANYLMEDTGFPYWGYWPEEGIPYSILYELYFENESGERWPLRTGTTVSLGEYDNCTVLRTDG